MCSIKLSPELKWNSYMLSLANDSGKIASILYHYAKYLTPLAIL